MGPTLCLKPSGTPIPLLCMHGGPLPRILPNGRTRFSGGSKVFCQFGGQFSVGTLGSFQVKIDSCVTTISSYVALTHGGRVLIIIIIIKDMIICHTSCYLYGLLDGTSSYPYMIFFSLFSLRSNSLVYLSMIC